MNIPKQLVLTAGDEPDEELLNLYLRDSLNFLLDPPEIYLIQTVSQSLTAGAWTRITFNAPALKDNDGMVAFINGSADRATIQTSGWYEFEYGTTWNTTTDATTNRIIPALMQNGGGAGLAHLGRADDETIPNASGRGGNMYPRYMNAGDYMELWQFHDGTAHTTFIGADPKTYLHGKWVSK